MVIRLLLLQEGLPVGRGVLFLKVEECELGNDEAGLGEFLQDFDPEVFVGVIEVGIWIWRLEGEVA